jgi:protein TonB
MGLSTTRMAGLFLLAHAYLYGADPDLRIAEAEAKKAAIARPAPEYPMMARQLKVTGQVAIEAVVDTSGAVLEARAASGNPILTKPALEAVKKWRFKPFTAGGKPAPALVSLSFEFR